VAAIGANGESGANFALALRGGDPDADYASVFLDEIGGFGLHFDVETGIAAALLDKEIQEVPLRHQGDEFAVSGKMREIGQGESFAAYLAAKLLQLLVRVLQEFFEEAEFVHQLESGRVDGVSAKVAEEIGVLFENEDFDAGAGEEEAEHHAGGAAAYYAAAGLW
jgi:hypothetical protein